MNFKATISNMLTDKFTRKIIFVLSLFNLIGYLVYRNFDAIIFFILIAGIVRYFSKNMTIVLLISIIIVNLFVFIKNTKEGMETDNSEKSKDMLNNIELQNKVNKINEKASREKGFPITPIDDDSKDDSNNNDINNNDSNNNDSNNNDSNIDNNSSETLAEPFQLLHNKKSNYDIDNFSTIEEAYSELNNITGDNITGDNLTSNTQNLLNQQNQLTEDVKKMTPLIEQMGNLLNK